jgi:transcription antitermination factor NusG
MLVAFFLSLWGILQIRVIDGFLPTPAPICRIPEDRTSTISKRSPIESSGINQLSRASKSSRLYLDLWERMEIDEDDEPYWYLLNCIAGLEVDLLRQVRQVSEKLPQEDVVKFVVPTVVKTRSHGANRMVRETKVKYQGYVFAKIRLTKETYETIKVMDLCRSWMGTINIKGYKKLPPAPLPLSEEEIENFDLENPVWEIDEQDNAAQKDQGIIVDSYENDKKELDAEEAIELEVKTVYKSLKVEDMIKVTAKNKFTGEDGIVKRLKEGNVLIRFFTYGQTFDEWLDPSDVRKLTDDEILKGLGGPSAPITQRDLDGDREEEERPQRKGSDARNSVGAFGGGPGRERRQDRTERSSRKDPMDDKKERENWNWYKENEKRNEGGGYDDGDGVEFRAGSRSESKRGTDKGNVWAEGDVDSQWGRNKKENRKNQQEDDWSSFVSQAPSDGKDKPKNAPSREETDDFFASLMTDLSKDSDGGQGRKGGSTAQPKEPASPSNDDDFFASLMSEIEDKPSSGTEPKTSKTKGNNNGDDDDDFFASLEREIKGPNSSSNKSATEKKSPVKSAVSSEEDDFFASLEMELASDLGEVKKDQSEAKSAVKTSPASDDASEDDFFSSLEAELRSDLDDTTGIEENDTIKTPALVKQKSSPERQTNDVPKNASNFDAAALKKRTVPELKDILRDRGLKVSGKKAELIERITSAL